MNLDFSFQMGGTHIAFGILVLTILFFAIRYVKPLWTVISLTWFVKFKLLQLVLASCSLGAIIYLCNIWHYGFFAWTLTTEQPSGSISVDNIGACIPSFFLVLGALGAVIFVLVDSWVLFEMKKKRPT